MDEVQLQYEYIEKAKKIVREKAEEKGSKLTCCVVTFGCQMNTEPEIFKTRINKGFFKTLTAKAVGVFFL